jgi:hypothetical protein
VVLGDALELAGHANEAVDAWKQACQEGNALAVDPKPTSCEDYWRGIAHCRLGRPAEAERVWQNLEARADELESVPSVPDYFATSLPELLLFDTGTASSRIEMAKSLRELAGLGRDHEKETAKL